MSKYSQTQVCLKILRKYVLLEKEPTSSLVVLSLLNHLTVKSEQAMEVCVGCWHLTVCPLGGQAVSGARATSRAGSGPSLGSQRPGSRSLLSSASCFCFPRCSLGQSKDHWRSPPTQGWGRRRGGHRNLAAGGLSAHTTFPPSRTPA